MDMDARSIEKQLDVEMERCPRAYETSHVHLVLPCPCRNQAARTGTSEGRNPASTLLPTQALDRMRSAC